MKYSNEATQTLSYFGFEKDYLKKFLQINLIKD